MHKRRYCKTYLTHSFTFGTCVKPWGITVRFRSHRDQREISRSFIRKKSSSPLSHARLHNRLQRDLQSWKKYFKGFQSQSFAQSLFIGMPVLISWDVSHFAWDPYKDWIWHTKAHINNIQWYETVDKLPWISELHWLPFSAQMQARSSQPSFLTIYSHQQKHTELHTQKRSYDIHDLTQEASMKHLYRLPRWLHKVSVDVPWARFRAFGLAPRTGRNIGHHELQNTTNG